MMPATPQQAEKKAEAAAEQAKRRGASPGQVEAIKLETYARERGAVVEPVTTTADGRSTSVTLRGEEHTGFRLSNGKDTALIDYSAGLDAVSDFLGDSPARALGMQYAAQVMTIQQKSQQAFDDGYNRGFVSSVRSGVRAQQQQQLQTARQLDAQSLQKWQADQARAKMTTLEKVQLGFDVVGMTEIPGVSQLAELGSAGISLYNGDYVGAGLGVASMIPIAGKWAEVAKVERLTERVKSYSDVVTNSVPAFSNDARLIQHFEKHGNEFRVNSADEYLNVGQDIVRNGHQIEYLYKGETRTGYISYMRNNQRTGESLFGFVGMNPEGAIATIHTKSRTDVFKLMGDVQQSQLKIFRTDTIGPNPQLGWNFPYKSN